MARQLGLVWKKEGWRFDPNFLPNLCPSAKNAYHFTDDPFHNAIDGNNSSLVGKVAGGRGWGRLYHIHAGEYDYNSIIVSSQITSGGLRIPPPVRVLEEVRQGTWCRRWVTNIILKLKQECRKLVGLKLWVSKWLRTAIQEPIGFDLVIKCLWFPEEAAHFVIESSLPVSYSSKFI